MACLIKTATEIYRDLCLSHRAHQMKTSEVRAQGNYGQTALLSKLAAPIAAYEWEQPKCCPISQQSIARVCCATINSTSSITIYQRFDVMIWCMAIMTLFRKQHAPLYPSSSHVFFTCASIRKIIDNNCSSVPKEAINMVAARFDKLCSPTTLAQLQCPLPTYAHYW